MTEWRLQRGGTYFKLGFDSVTSVWRRLTVSFRRRLPGKAQRLLLRCTGERHVEVHGRNGRRTSQACLNDFWRVVTSHVNNQNRKPARSTLMQNLKRVDEERHFESFFRRQGCHRRVTARSSRNTAETCEWRDSISQG